MWEEGGDLEPGPGEINKKDYHSLTQLSGFLADVTQELGGWSSSAVKCELEGLDASNARKQKSRAS